VVEYRWCPLQTSGVSTSDEILHRAIDLLQVIVINLEGLGLQPEIKDTYSGMILGNIAQQAMDCANLLHEACRENINSITE